MSTFGVAIPVTGLNLGFPGQVSRTGEKVVVARQADPGNAHNISFGQAVVILTSASSPAATANATPGTYQSVADFIAASGTFTAAKFAGVAIREVTTLIAFTSLYQPNTTAQLGSYPPGNMAEVLERGSITITCAVGTPVSQGTVYIRTALNVAIPAGIVGDFEAAADGGNTVALTNVVWRTGVLDANRTAEITLLNRAAA